MKLVPISLALALCTSAHVRAQQASVTLAPTQDNSIYSENATLSNGSGSRLFAGRTQTAASRRALLQFDVAASVPPGSTIQSVRLELTVAQTVAPDLPVAVHRVTRSWGEGASQAAGGQGSGAPAQPGDATWAQAIFPGTNWQNAGGDFVATASASVVVGATGTFAWSSAQMVADVQSWLDTPGGAFGWIVVTDETTQPTARAFHAREASTAAQRPRLVVGYLPPAAQLVTVGSGCTGGGTQPMTLGANGNPTVPAPNFTLSLTGGPSGSVAVIDIFFSLLPNPIPLGGGCSFWGDPAAFIAGVTVTGSLPLAIPNLPDLIGRSLATQGIAVVPGPGTLAASNGLVLRFGV